MAGFAPSVWPDTDLSAAGLAPLDLAGDIEPAVLGQQINTIKNGHAYLDWLSLRIAIGVHNQVIAEAAHARDIDAELPANHKLLDVEAQTILRLAHYGETGEYQARMLLDDALTARDRLPRCAELLRIGRIDRRRFHRLADETSLVLSTQTLARLDAVIADEIGAAGSAVLSITAVENIARRRVAELDPDAVRARRDAAKASRAVFSRTIGNGMSALTVTGTAEDIRLVELSLAAIVDGLCPNDPRTKTAALSDAVVARLTGQSFTCRCDREDCTASLGDGAIDVRTARIVLHVLCDSTTLDGAHKAGYLDGYGPISADHTRELARRDDARIRYHDLNDLCEGTDPEGTFTDEQDTAEQDTDDAAAVHRQPSRPVTPDECGGDTPRAEPETGATNTETNSGTSEAEETATDIAPGPAGEERTPDPDLPATGGSNAHCSQPPVPDPGCEPAGEQLLSGAGTSVVIAWAGATPTVGSGVASGAQTAMEALFAPAVIDFGRPLDSDEQPWWAQAWEQIVATVFGPWHTLVHTALPSDPYRPTTLTDLVARFLWGCCSIAGCERAAFSCDLDHVAEFNNICPASGGPTCLCNLLPKCRFHHLVKTHLDGFIDELWIDETGRYHCAITIGGITAETLAPNQWLLPQLTHMRCGHLDDGDTHAERTPDGACQSGPDRARTRTQAKHSRRRAERARNRRAREQHRRTTQTPVASPIRRPWDTDGPPPF